MGAKVTVGGYRFHGIRDWQITEDSTPLAATDTSGSTGILTVTINAPDPDLEHIQDTGAKWLLTFTHNVLLEKAISFEDPRWGSVSGKVTGVSKPDPGSIRITATTDLNRLNAFNLRMLPFSGTLGGLLRAYISRAGITEAPDIDASLETRSISAPGWRGELWYHLKMLAQAEEFDIALVNGVFTFRRLRQQSVIAGLDKARGNELQVSTLAQAVEVYQWNNRSITNELIWPVGGWTPETEVFNVNAGELAQYQIELESSVTSVVQPVLQEFVAPNYGSSSVYTVVADDGLPVPPALWDARGGAIRVLINPDTRSLTLRLRGAVRIPLSTGEYAKNFSIALASDTSGARYSTLRIVGTGVAFKREKLLFRTGVTSAQTGTEVGATIDNPFLSDKEQVCRAGVRAAAMFAGPVPTLSKDVVAAFPPGTPTLGNISGARVYDKSTARHYRSRSANVGPSGVSASFDDDLLHSDMQAVRQGLTYGDVQASRDGVTYRDDYLAGER